jgi:2-C-methyl-D-erythritol 4-phosphate cytidylyltransferase
MSTSAASQIHVLIPCAGSGSRAGSAAPKQYQLLQGRTLVMHTVLALARVPAIASGWLVLAPGDTHDWSGHSADEGIWPAHFKRIYAGGASRAHSVFNGLAAMLAAGVSPSDWVLVHDAARCLVAPSDVARLIAQCQHDAVGGLLALPLPDTLKAESEGRSMETITREGKWLAQTPQMFRLQALHDALLQAADTDFVGITDEASAMERLGLAPQLVQGSAENFKVTYPADFALANTILKGRACMP